MIKRAIHVLSRPGDAEECGHGSHGSHGRALVDAYAIADDLQESRLEFFRRNEVDATFCRRQFTAVTACRRARAIEIQELALNYEVTTLMAMLGHFPQGVSAPISRAFPVPGVLESSDELVEVHWCRDLGDLDGAVRKAAVGNLVEF